MMKLAVTLTKREARALKTIIQRVNFLNVNALRHEDTGLAAAYSMHTKLMTALRRAGASEGDEQ